MDEDTYDSEEERRKYKSDDDPFLPGSDDEEGDEEFDFSKFNETDSSIMDDIRTGKC